MAKIRTRADLSEYALRRLGKPVITINVSNEQIEDRIDDALQYYFEFHDEGSYLAYLSHQLTQADLDNGYIDVPESVYSVHTLLAGGGANGIFSKEFNVKANTILGVSGTAEFQVFDYTMMRQHLALIENELSTDNFRFVRPQGRIYIDSTKSQAVAGDYVVFECYKMVDDTVELVYNDVWLKEYVTALIKKQWGENIKKFSGVQLAGGVELNGKDIFEEAVEELEKLEEKLETKFNQPAAFLIG